MNQNDKDFLLGVMHERMTFHYGRSFDPGGKKAKEFAAREEALVQVLEPLTEEQRQVFREYLDCLFERNVEQEELYYRSGLADGYKLCLLAQQMGESA